MLIRRYFENNKSDQNVLNWLFQSYFLLLLFIMSVAMIEFFEIVSDSSSQLISVDSDNSFSENIDQDDSNVRTEHEIFARKKNDRRVAASSLDILMMTKQKDHVLWIVDTADEFEEWWSKHTSWDQDTKLRLKNHRSSQWDSIKRVAEVWQRWHEAIFVIREFSKVICKECDKIYNHFTSDNNDNNEMIAHILKNEVCFKSKFSNQQSIDQIFQTID